MTAPFRKSPPRWRVAVTMLGLAGMLAGCDILGPEDHPRIDGVFVLTDGPSDTLVFQANQTGEWIRILEATAPPLRARTAFTYRSTREALEMTMYCPPNANCVDGPHYSARLDHGELIVAPLHLESSEPARRFRRVAR